MRALVTIDSQIRLYREDLDPDLERAITSRLTRSNPEWEKRKQYGRYSGNIDRLLRFYRISDGQLVCPRGSLAMITKLLKASGRRIVWDVDGVTSRSIEQVDLDDLDVTLRPYQRECIQEMIRQRQGIVEMPCGAGKTTTAASALLATGEPALVLVHTQDILDQWVQTITRLTAGDKPRVIVGSKSNFAPVAPGEIVVAMVQTISQDRRDVLVLNSIGALCIDEAHHVPASLWRPLVNGCSAKYRWGLTATPERADGMEFVLRYIMGSTVFRIGTQELIRQGHLLKPCIIPVETGWGPSDKHYPCQIDCIHCGTRLNIKGEIHAASGTECYRCEKTTPCDVDPIKGRINYAKAVSDAGLDPGRNRAIVEIAKTAADDGRTILILVNRVKAVWKLVSQLQAEGVTAVGVTGKDPREARSRKLKDVATGRASVAVATQLADEGLDLPALDCAIVASAGRSKGRARQRVGRVLRPVGRQPVVFELVDGGEFTSQWESRKRAYEREYGSGCITDSFPIAPMRAIARFRKMSLDSDRI